MQRSMAVWTLSQVQVGIAMSAVLENELLGVMVKHHDGVIVTTANLSIQQLKSCWQWKTYSTTFRLDEGR